MAKSSANAKTNEDELMDNEEPFVTIKSDESNTAQKSLPLDTEKLLFPLRVSSIYARESIMTAASAVIISEQNNTEEPTDNPPPIPTSSNMIEMKTLSVIASSPQQNHEHLK